MKIRKNDLVRIMVGKDRGKSGKVIRVSSKQNKAIVEGLNVYKRHVRRAGQEGAVVDILKPVNISNLALICPNCDKISRVSFKENGGKIRICKKCGKEIVHGQTKR